MAKPKKVAAKMFRSRMEKIRDHEKTIANLEKRIDKIKGENRVLFKDMHNGCPLCGGSGVVSVSGGYDSSRSWEQCPYKLEWLLGEKTPPSDWRKELRQSGWRV